MREPRKETGKKGSLFLDRYVFVDPSTSNIYSRTEVYEIIAECTSEDAGFESNQVYLVGSAGNGPAYGEGNVNIDDFPQGSPHHWIEMNPTPNRNPKPKNVFTSEPNLDKLISEMLEEWKNGRDFPYATPASAMTRKVTRSNIDNKLAELVGASKYVIMISYSLVPPKN